MKAKLNKLFTLLTILTLGITNVWGAYYIPTADEVIKLQADAYKSDGTNYSKHAAVAWAGNPSFSDKKAGDPDNGGALTSSNVKTCSVKGNGGGKDLTISITGCSKIIVYHEKHSSRYVELRSGSKTGTLIGSGSANTAYSEINLDGSTSYDLFLHGTTGSDDQDFYVYAVKLIKDDSGADPVAVTGITITPSPVNVKVGKTKTLTATVTPNNATDKAVTWAVTSGGTYASVVEATGVVTGLAEGTAVITATAHDGSGVTQTVTVNVSACPTSGTLFSMTVTDPDGKVYTDVTSEAPQEIGATYTGGVAYATSTSTSKRSPKITGSEFDFNVGSGGSVAVKVELDCPLAEGDIITFTSTHDKEFYIRKVVGTDLHTTSSLKLEIPAGSALIGEEVFYIMRTNSVCSFSKINIVRPVYRTITLEYADGETAAGSLEVIEGEAATKPADPTWAHHRFAGWYNGSDPYDWSANVTGDLTLTAHWTQLYTISFNNGGGSGDAPAAIADKAQSETFTVPANTFTAPAGQVFDKWNDGTNDYDPDDTYTVGTNNVTLTAVWRTPSTMYAITKGAHENGDFTIAPASQEAGEIVTLEATPNEDYLFSAWEVVKTEDASATGITVDANGQFTMPAYAVTVNATFVADTRKKILYVTNNDEATTKANDKLYEALKDDYRITIVSYGSNADQTNYDLVVLHESVGGGNYGAAAVAAAKGGAVPVLNTKSYFYNDGRWGWGSPNAGQTVKGATLNSAYCNIANHPLFSGVAMTDGFFEITDDAAAKCMQPIGSFASGKEGYTLATTPNNGEGNGCAIHELTPAQRGASAGKYLMISVSGDKLSALNANGQKLFQNAAAYLIDGTASWTPVAVPTSPVVAATPTENYTEGGTITLTASAEGTSASTVYTWYKGVDWATASATTPVQAASTSGATFSKTAVVGDAGTYWCNISNGTSCDAQASVTITVSSASTPTHAISYDNVKDADMTAYPTEYTEGIGVASFDPLADITGWHFVEWSPASIATDATTDQTITAVWAQVFEVTFNLQGHGAEIAKQDIISGEKATEPTDPSAIGYDFGGWFTDAECTAGNEFDFDTPITAATPLFAKWAAFDGCALLYPALSGDAPTAKNQAIDLQSGSFGGAIKTAGAKENKWNESFAYTANGLGLQKGGADSLRIELNNDMKVGTVIKVKIYASDASSRGLYLKNLAKTTKMEMTQTEVGAKEYTYTVEEGDGLAGTNAFLLSRNNTVYLQSVKVSNCGAAITYHNLTSEVNIAGKGTVTLGASSVREGYTTTAEYSEIDPAYEFVNWTVSGAGASIADATANPATITMGTEDVIVTLNLQLIPVKFTVNYFDGTTPMGTEQVAVTENPTASTIVTAKRGYVFEGWAMSSTATASDVVALNTITSDVTTTIDLYAVYTEIPCPTEGTVFSMEVTDPADTEYNGNNEFNLEIGATYVGGKAYSGSKNSTNRVGVINENGEYAFKNNGDVTIKIAMDCALQEGDVITFTTSTTRELKIQKVAGTDLVTTSGKKYVIPAASPLIGVYDFYLMRGNSESTMKTFKVTRPYTITFDMQGHGDAIDAQKLIAGDKVVEPTAPTATGWDFKGWYKESACTNAWDFENDVVAGTMALYAKWDVHVTNDATLKSLKYGSEAIALEDGVFEYNIGLPAATVAVPALTAVANSVTVHSLDIADAAAFDGDGKATSTVTVVSEDETVTNVYTVNFSKMAELPQVNIAASTTWDFSTTVAGSTTLENQTDVVLANMPGINNNANFNSQALIGSFNKLPGNYFQGSKLSFTTEVDGKLTITFRGTNNNERHLQVCVGDGEMVVADWNYKGSGDGAQQTQSVIVPAGKVTLKAFEGEAANNARIYSMIFKTPDYTRDVSNNIGTLCVDHNVPAGGALGATFYQLVGKELTYGKLVFDEVTELVAGEPYIFESTTGSIALYYGATVAATPVEVNHMIGSYVDTKVTITEQNKKSVMYISNNKLWDCSDYLDWTAQEQKLQVLANRAYIANYDAIEAPTSASPAPGRRRITVGKDGQNATTDVDLLNAAEAPVKMIIDGKMYILRGEKMYNANGQLVK